MRRWPFWMALLIAAAMFAFPPVGYPGTYGRITGPTYWPLWELGNTGRVIDYWRFLIQCALVFGLAYMVASAGRKSP